MNDSTENTPNNRQFKILLILLMVTWLVVGGDLLINMFARQNSETLFQQTDDNIMAIASMKLRLDVLDSKIQAIINQGHQKAAVPEQKVYTGDIKESISGINQRTDVLADKIDEVSSIIKKSEANGIASNLVVSAVRLRDAVKESRSFASDVAALRAISQNKPEIEPQLQILDKYAQNGVPSVTMLKGSFDRVADAIASLARTQKKDPTIIDRIFMRFENMVQIRKIAPKANGNETDDILARSYNALLKNDLKVTIAELDKLSPELKFLASEWVQQAQGNIDSQAAADKIFAIVSY
jgi:hypothetical protein